MFSTQQPGKTKETFSKTNVFEQGSWINKTKLIVKPMFSSKEAGKTQKTYGKTNVFEPGARKNSKTQWKTQKTQKTQRFRKTSQLTLLA